MSRWMVGVLVGLAVLIVVAVYLNSREEDRMQRDDAQEYRERRRIYVETMGRSMPGGTLSLGGIDGETLIMDFDGCGPNTLRSLLHNDKIAVPMMEAHFSKLRCRDSGIEVTVPR